MHIPLGYRSIYQTIWHKFCKWHFIVAKTHIRTFPIYLQSSLFCVEPLSPATHSSFMLISAPISYLHIHQASRILTVINPPWRPQSQSGFKTESSSHAVQLQLIYTPLDSPLTSMRNYSTPSNASSLSISSASYITYNNHLSNTPYSSHIRSFN